MKRLLILFIFFFSYTTYSQTAEEYYIKGVEKAGNGDYEGAITDWTKAIEIDPKYVNAYYNRGISKYKLGDMNGACEDWRKAANLGDEDAQDYLREHCNKQKTHYLEFCLDVFRL